MSGFGARIQGAQEFERVLDEMLRRHPRVVDLAKNGTEHTHASFVERLRTNSSPASKFVRYAPDGVVLLSDNTVWHYEAKRGNSLERDAYEVYKAYAAGGCTVMLFFLIGSQVFFQRVEMVRFLDSREEVAKFEEHRRFPVDEDNWICPRLKAGFRPTDRMSGTPFRYVDPASLRRWAGK